MRLRSSGAGQTPISSDQDSFRRWLKHWDKLAECGRRWAFDAGPSDILADCLTEIAKDIRERGLEDSVFKVASCIDRDRYPANNGRREAETAKVVLQWLSRLLNGLKPTELVDHLDQISARPKLVGMKQIGSIVSNGVMTLACSVCGQSSFDDVVERSASDLDEAPVCPFCKSGATRPQQASEFSKAVADPPSLDEIHQVRFLLETLSRVAVDRSRAGQMAVGGDYVDLIKPISEITKQWSLECPVELLSKHETTELRLIDPLPNQKRYSVYLKLGGELCYSSEGVAEEIGAVAERWVKFLLLLENAKRPTEPSDGGQQIGSGNVSSCPHKAFQEFADGLANRNGKLARFLASASVLPLSFDDLAAATDPLGGKLVFRSQNKEPSDNAIAKAVNEVGRLGLHTGVTWSASEAERIARRKIQNP